MVVAISLFSPSALISSFLQGRLNGDASVSLTFDKIIRINKINQSKKASAFYASPPPREEGIKGC